MSLRDDVLLAKHFRQARYLVVGDNAQGYEILATLGRGVGGILRFKVCNKLGDEMVLAWFPEEWIPLGDDLPPREATDALMRRLA